MTLEQAAEKIAGYIREDRYKKSIRELAVDVIVQSTVKTGDYAGELRVLFEFVRDRIRYIKDPYERDIYQDSDTTLKMKSGDCEDQAILLSSLCQAVGYPIAIKFIATEGTTWDHVYSLGGLPPKNPTRWVAMDSTLENGRLGLEASATYSKTYKLNEILTVITEEKAPEVTRFPDWAYTLLNWAPLALIPIIILLIREARK